MRFLVLSHKHRLLPFAWRLKREGHEVQVAQVNAKEAYQRAWEGRFECFLRGVDRVSERASEAVRAAAEEAEAYVLTDSTRWTGVFAGYPRLFGAGDETPGAGMWLTGWFDGERIVAQGVVLEDVGAWTGGQGPRVAGSATLLRLPAGHPWGEALTTQEDSLKSAGFRGLVSALVRMDVNEWGVNLLALHLGWKPLHTHLWVSDMELGEVLAGAVPTLPKRFTVGAVVSIPPWPNRPAEPVPSIPIEVRGPDPNAVTREVFFHDMRIEGQQLFTVGLDGLVGVVRGAGDTLPRARMLCRTRCDALLAEGLQYRLDAGGGADRVLTLADTLGHAGSLV